MTCGLVTSSETGKYVVCFLCVHRKKMKEELDRNVQWKSMGPLKNSIS